MYLLSVLKTWNNPSGAGINKSLCTSPVLYARSQKRKNANITIIKSDADFLFDENSFNKYKMYAIIKTIT